MLDLRTARNALEQMAESCRKDFKIGRIVKDLFELSSYKKGEIILFRNDRDGTVTVEKPYTAEEIERRRKEGSLIVSCGCMINVPKGYVEEVKI